MRATQILGILEMFVMFVRTSSAIDDPSSDLSGDVSVLLSIKAVMAPYSSSYLQGWVASNYTNYCSWTGVRCDCFDRVVELDLSNMNFSCPVPSEITNLSALRSLNISNNMFNGSLPANISKLKNLEMLDAYNNNLTQPRLPRKINRLRKLKHLDLGGNYISGSIPGEYGKLKKLKYLSLAGNRLTGRIPGELGNLKKLQKLLLGYFNAFIGGIPAELGNLSKLVYLDMASCYLDGTIPWELGNLENLNSLFLHSNHLSGPIPSHLGNLVSLMSLDLSDNELTGEIPEEFSKLKNLTLLNLFMNNLHGGIPSFVGDLPNLEVLQLWKNNLTGPVPQQLGLNGNLLEVDVSSNKLTGFIPPNLCNSQKLQIVIILDNFFVGPIPESLGTCESLIRVRMEQNYLNGSIPSGLLYLPNLGIIELNGNNLSGSIPEAGINMVSEKLFQISLSRNRLSGSLPSSIGNFRALQLFMIDGNQLSGTIPQEIGLLTQITKIDFRKNRFSGRIPAQISLCGILTYIDLSQNQFSGPIPIEITKMRILNYLNISRNRFNGSIPREFENMLWLNSVDFSYNNFSGLAPDLNPSSFAGNPGLCGPYLRPCISANSTPNGAGLIPRPFSSTAFILLSALIILLFFLLFVVCGILKAKTVRKQHSLSSWNLTVFRNQDFSIQDILDSLKEENVIGKGGAGIVYRGIMPNGEEVAVKKLMGINRGSSHDYGFSTEIQILGRIRHRHIVKLLAFCSNHETNLLVYEYMPNGSLGEILHGNKGGYLDWHTRYTIATEAAKGLCYLHNDCSPLIVHRDVKSNNILLDSKFEAHVADFGLAVFLQNSGASECMSRIAGSFGYIAPEYAYTLKVDEKIDVYSFGVVLLELITGRKPVGEFGDGVNIVQWVKRMTNCARDGVVKILDSRLDSSVPLEEAMHLFFVALLCVEEYSADRPNMREVVQMLADAPKNNLTQCLSPFDADDDDESTKPVCVQSPDEDAKALGAFYQNYFRESSVE
eukprot:Gb_27191 [translate_table: standard]